jgi:phosphoglycerate dehydrogenase-like enzyme
MMCIPSRLVISGRLAPILAEALADARPELGVRIVDARELSADDLLWADSYCGFVLPANIGDSDVRWVHLMTAGVDSVVSVLRAMPSPPILTRTVGTMPEKIASYVLCHVLAEFQRTDKLRDLQAERRWTEFFPTPHVGETAVILGAGHLGARIASAMSAVGFRTVGVSRGGVASPAFDSMCTPLSAASEYAGCAALVCALPLTAETRQFVGREILGALEAAVFVNVGRGATVVESDLREALDSGSVRRAVLDVFEREPLPADSWLWGHERVTVTPHVAAITETNDVLSALASVLLDFDRGRIPADAVNLERGY